MTASLQPRRMDWPRAGMIQSGNRWGAAGWDRCCAGWPRGSGHQLDGRPFSRLSLSSQVKPVGRAASSIFGPCVRFVAMRATFKDYETMKV